MNKQLLAAAIVIVAGTAFFVPWGGAAAAAGSAESRDLWTVQRGDLRITLVENGTMVAKESKKVTAKIRNESKILWLVEEGKEVKEDDVVCKLDASQVNTRLEQVKINILTTEANLKRARTELEIQTVEKAAAEHKAQVAIDKARMEIEKYRDGEAPQARRKLEVSLKDAESKFGRMRKNLEDSKKLLLQNYIKKSELEDHELAFESASVQLESAKTDLELFDKYTFPMTRTDHDTKLADALREIDNAKKRGEATLGEKSVAVQQAEKHLQAEQQQRKEREEDLSNMTMKAPCPGIVVYGNPHEYWNRERIKVGNQIYEGQTVLTIPDLREMSVKLFIHEADISKLKVGLKAVVTTDSYPGMQLAGEVTKIATVANGNSEYGGSSEVKMFDVAVTLKTPDLQLRPGISAKVEIHVDVREKALYVPLQSVFAEEGEHFCHVQAVGKSPKKCKITIGTSNDNYLEVLDGLRDGDLVLLYNPLLPTGGEAKANRDAEKKPAAAPAATPTAPTPVKAGP